VNRFKWEGATVFEKNNGAIMSEVERIWREQSRGSDEIVNNGG